LTVIILECGICNKKFERSRGEYNRSKKLGRSSFCSRKCSGINNTKNFDEYYQNGGKRFTEHLNPANRRDGYSSFKWFMRVIKRRNKEKGKDFDVDLKYLKELWEHQKGICPFTDWQLELPIDSTNWNMDGDKLKRASLDRIDNSKGYVKGNVRFVAIMANYCRHIFSDNEVRLFCEAVTSTKKVDTWSQVG